MANFIIKTLLKFLSYDVLVEVIAKGLAYLMEYARKKATPEGWDKAKKTIKAIKTWTALFDQVYEDDTLTPEEEKLVQAAISNCTCVESIYKILNKKAPRKVAKRAPVKKTTKRGTAK